MSTRLRLLILEDDSRRIDAMRERLEDRLPQYDTLLLPDCASFTTAFLEAPERVLAVSLDHDLEPQPSSQADPGTGRDVADFLANLSPTNDRVPVLIHSTNILAADGMERVLNEAGYHVTRVVPYGDLEWISQAWFPAFRRLILTTGEPSTVVAGARPAR